MAIFDFKLEGVLRQRKSAEKERQRELAAHSARMAELDSQLRAIDGSVRASEQDLRDNRLRGRIDLTFLAAHRRFAFAMQKKALEIARNMAGVHRQVEEARQNLVKAAQGRKAIEKLREKQLRAWQESQSRRELAALDEVATQMSYRVDADNYDSPEGQTDDPVRSAMKKLFSVLVLTLAMNFLAVGAGAAWLVQSAHLDKAKLLQVRDLLFPPSTASTTAPSAEQSATQPSQRLDELLAQQLGRPASEQAEFIQQKFDEQMLQLDRRQRELIDLQRQVDLANQKLASDRKALQKAQQALDQRQKEADRLQTDQGFQDSLALYNSMPSKQVKTIFMTLGEATVQQYLQAMEPRNASKIIKEFKTPDETAFIQRILERMRQPNAAGGPPRASASDQTPR